MPPTKNTSIQHARPPSADAVRQQLLRIVASEPFAASRRHQALLRYLVENSLAGDLGALKETVIAVEVFDRSAASFNPRADPIVRVESRRLRARLRNYYAVEGAQDPIILELPVGAYRLLASQRTGWQQRTPVQPGIQAATGAGSATLQAAAGIEATPVVTVLPFTNATGDPAYTALGEAMADELIDTLARHPALRVIAPSSELRVHPDGAEAIVAAARLGASAIVLGRIERATDGLAVTARIALVPDTGLAWSTTYHVKPRDFLSLQRQLAQEIAAALLSETSTGPQVTGTTHPQARDAYLGARTARDRMTAADMRESIALARKAISLDPRFARAHTQLGIAIISLPFFEERVITAAERDEARRAVYTAYALDPDDAKVVLALASYALQHDYDWPEAAHFCRRALALAPDDGDALRAYGVLMEFAGRFPDADRFYQRALELEPDSDYTRAMLTALPLFAGDFEEAKRRARALLEIQPASQQAHFIFIRALMAQRRWHEAHAALDEAERHLPGSPMFSAIAMAVQVHIESDSGTRIRLEQWADSPAARAAPITAAGVFALVDDAARVFRFLELAFDARDGNLPLVRFSPEFRGVLSHRRFSAILARMPHMRAMTAASFSDAPGVAQTSLSR